MGSPVLKKINRLINKNSGRQITIRIKANILFNIIIYLLPYNYSMNFSLTLVLFLFLLPSFGVVFHYGESIVFYGGIIYFLFISKWAQSYKNRTSFFNKYLIVIFITALISVLTSKNISPSYYGLINLIFIFVLLDLILRHVKAEMVYRYLLYSTLLYSTIFFLNKIGLIPLTKDSYGDNFILQIWGHSYLAELLVFPIVALLYQLISGQKVYPYRKLINYFILIFLVICLFLTHARSALITILISFTYLNITLLKSTKLKILFCTIAALSTLYVFFMLSQNTLKSTDGSRLEYWSEAYQAFINRPLFGQGPNNFFYINKIYQSKAFTNTNYAHSSILDFLSTYGLVFTGLFFTLIFSALVYQKKHSPLNFILGFAGISNSLYEASWNSLGIFCISLIFIFYDYPKLYTINKSNPKMISILKYLLLIFFLSKTLSDLAFVDKNYSLSISLDPFNTNPRLALIDQGIYLKSNSLIFGNHFYSYKRLVNNQTPQPSNLQYFNKIIDLNPKESISEYTKLSSYFYQNKDFDGLKHVLDKAFKYIDISQISLNHTIDIAKVSYSAGIDYWHNSNFDLSIDYLKKAAYFSQGWSHFQIELANAYWHTGQKDLAIKQLALECQKFPKSVFHCQQYLDTYQNNLPEPGNLNMVKEIESINPKFIY